MHNKKRYRR